MKTHNIMKKDIKFLLESKKQKIQVREYLLKENVKIKRTQPLGGGYYIIVLSDLQGDAGTKESAMMGKVLKLTKSDVWPHSFEKPKYFKDNKSGKFGWGYFIGPNTPEEKALESLSNLKLLVKTFNEQKNLAVDLESEGLTLNQIQQIEQITQAVEVAIEGTENPVIQSNLTKYLDDLQDAVESGEVYEFLIANFENAKKFQNNNSRIAGWKYSILNALIISISDPTAEYAGPVQYWDGRNYQLKPGAKGNGIFIFKPGKKSDIGKKVDYFKQNPDAVDAFKREHGIEPDENFSVDDTKNAYQLAKFATEKKYVRSAGVFERVMVYTNNMVEPIPGKETKDFSGGLEYDIQEPVYTENLNPLFDAVLEVANDERISIPSSLTTDKNSLNNFSKVLHAIGLSKVSKGIQNKGGNNESAELAKVQAESIAHIIKKNYKLPSTGSQYSIASWGGDKETLRKNANAIIKIADELVKKIDTKLNPTTSVSESKIAIDKLKSLIREEIVKLIK